MGNHYRNLATLSPEEAVVKNLAKFTGKHLCRSLFFIKGTGLRPTIVLKRDSDAYVFL